MQLIPYWVGGSVVAARSEEGAIAVMELHESAGHYTLDDVMAMPESQLDLQVTLDAPETFREALARCQAESPSCRPDSRLAQAQAGMGRPQLIYWDFPSA
ncbi:hypothetical protein ABKS89_30390 [Pseudomonas sp. LABIM340]|uniref:hypothetical protein n=1 Tax=Pseudomonas sp. LABIM340 TaxID=3156585 RepID=UPI0032AED044